MSDEAPEDEAEQADPSAPAPAEAAPRARPPRRRKKRRRAVEEEALPVDEAADERAAPAPSGPEVPAFARGFPADPALDALVAAFEAGDYARVRREAPALARATESDEVRAAARELERRLRPDPIAAYLLAAAAALLVFLAGWYWTHPHAP
jgi:hypothetical protein